MNIKKYATTVALIAFGFGVAAVGCGGGDGGSDAKGGTGGTSKKTGGTSGKTGGTSGKTGGTSGKTGGTSGTATGGTSGTATGGTSGTATGGTSGTATGGSAATGGVPAGAAGPIGYWKFDEGTGTAVADSSGNSNAGMVVQGATSAAGAHPAPVWADGKFGKALSINGLNEWVRVADSDSIDNTGIMNNVSTSAWIKLNKYNALKPFNVVVQRHMAATRVEQFLMGMVNGAPAVGINFFYGTGVTNVPLNEWVHMAMTYDGIQQCGYINGVMSICQDVGWPVATDETPVTMGGGINENDVIEHIDGLIDEVQLYDVALTAAQVDALAKKL
jgi:Concanavalin A-like lectin/glucanases superfamily